MTSQATRNHIIQVGADLIARKGFGATGLNAVLTASGVPKGSFYHYFSSKNDFGLAVIESFGEEYEIRLEQILTDPSRSCIDRLHAYFDTGLQTMTSGEYSQGCLMGNLGQELAGQHEMFRTRLDKVFTSWERKFSNCIAEAQANGDIDPALDPDEVASFLLSGWEGAILRAKVVKSTEPMERFVKVFLNQCLRIG